MPFKLELEAQRWNSNKRKYKLLLHKTVSEVGTVLGSVLCRGSLFHSHFSYIYLKIVNYFFILYFRYYFQQTLLLQLLTYLLPPSLEQLSCHTKNSIYQTATPPLTCHTQGHEPKELPFLPDLDTSEAVSYPHELARTTSAITFGAALEVAEDPTSTQYSESTCYLPRFPKSPHSCTLFIALLLLLIN